MVHTAVARPRGAPTGPDTHDTGPVTLRRKQLSHDIRHELATIMLLASMIDEADDVGADSRLRARQLAGEARWLDRLHSAFEEATARESRGPAVEPVRVDLFAAEVVAAVRLSSPARVSLTAREAWARADRLMLWRALRNVVGNAARAAGAGGRVRVRVAQEGGWAVASVDDDGPGFGAAPPGLASLGLGIVRDSVASCGGDLRIRPGELGGCCVRLRIPATPLARPGGDGAAAAV
jgi:signal transduction histidine kinase